MEAHKLVSGMIIEKKIRLKKDEGHIWPTGHKHQIVLYLLISLGGLSLSLSPLHISSLHLMPPFGCGHSQYYFLPTCICAGKKEEEEEEEGRMWVAGSPLSPAREREM